MQHIDNPASLPPVNQIDEVREPIILANILVPQSYLGAVIGLCVEKRGVQRSMQYLGQQVSLSYELPLSEVVLDFFDRLKSVSRGYASLDYQFTPNDANCDDGVGCSDDTCDAMLDCQFYPNDENCENGEFCDEIGRASCRDRE